METKELHESMRQDILDYQKNFNDAIKDVAAAIKWQAQCEQRLLDAKLALIKFEIKNNLNNHQL